MPAYDRGCGGQSPVSRPTPPRPGDRRRGPQLRDERRRQAGLSDAAIQRPPQQRELHPAGDARRRRQARHAPARIDADPSRQRQRARVAEPGGQRHAHHREAQRRARIAQRVVRRRVQPAQRGGQQSDGRPGQDPPHVHANRRA